VTTVESLKIDDIEKAIYYGDEITAADLSITCVYSDGEEVALADSGFADQLGELVYDTTVFGDIDVAVTLTVSAYDIEVTGTAKATVIAPNGLKVVKVPDKTTYQVDDQLDTTGLEVAYDYGTEVEARVIDNSKLTFRANLSEPGKATVKVSDGTYNTSFDITVEGTVATTSTTSTTSTTATTASTSSGGCGSMIGIGAIAVIACISVAGAAIIRKKED
ncbi:MAG: bacterial Ig-like domain-containing protein, partial [Clostridia bacterium]|nr:bacterial Ig-like domain-containing protein [Clostridia bacterium]